MDTPLHLQHCRPLRGEENRVSAELIDELLKRLDGWRVSTDRQSLQKTVPFNDYYQTLAFVNALGFMAHMEDHHPDLGVHYNRCEIMYSTHDVGGLSMNDFICAAKVDALLGG